MRIFDPHIHMVSRTTDDYERMALAGIQLVLEPAFWLGQPRTHVGTFIDYWSMIIEWERQRAANFGVGHVCTIAVNPKEANDEALAAEALEAMPEFLDRDGVVGVGEIGYDDITPQEEKIMVAQIEMALERDLPIMVHTPHRDKGKGTERSIAVLRDMDVSPDQVIIDHNTEESIGAAKDFGCWCGHTIYPDTKLSQERFANILDEYGTERMIANSSADWGPSDPLAVPKTTKVLLRRGYDLDTVQRIVWNNPVDFFGQSGKLEPLEAPIPDA